MLSIFKKQTTLPFNCATLAVDMHAHWLPGIDDGGFDELPALPPLP